MEVDCKALSQTASADYYDLYQSILDTLAPNQTNYIFFKYIDYWEHREKVINSLVLQENIDLYVVTTNNDSLMELFTKAFPGNYVSYVAS